MNPILEVSLVVFVMFAPVFVSVEAILFSSPKEWWSWVTNMFITGWIFLQEKWRYFFMNRLERIGHISKKINQTSDMAEQKQCLARLKDLAESYRKEQQKAVVPENSFLDRMISNDIYKPWVRAAIILLIAITLFFVFPKIESEIPFINVLNNYLGNTGTFALLSSPIAFFIWYYRDLNNYKERETAHRNVIFSEHKQLVEWATTEAKPDTNAPMIQVAGIYQLAPFLKDHHANLYQRSTLETLRAIVNAGRPKWEKWIVSNEVWHEQDEDFETIPSYPVLTDAEKAVHAVLRENPTLFYHPHFNAKDFNLSGFDGSGLVLVGCDLKYVMLACARLRFSNFRGADLRFSRLNGVNISNSRFECSNLRHANLSDANIIQSRLQGTDMEFVKLIRANLRGAKLNGVNLTKAKLLRGNFDSSDLRIVNLNEIRLNSDIFNGANFMNSLTDEPMLLEDVSLVEQVKIIILHGGLSIADEQVQSLPHYESLKSAHLAAVQALSEKGLAPTTKASLEAERQAQATTEK